MSSVSSLGIKLLEVGYVKRNVGGLLGYDGWDFIVFTCIRKNYGVFSL